MNKLISWLGLPLSFAFVSPEETYAREFIVAGECAVIVASRETVAEARDFILDEGFSDRAIVYSAKNGWLAISIGTAPINLSEETLRKLKSNGKIPKDSYCSTGKAYTGVVNWQGVGNGIPSVNQRLDPPVRSASPTLLLFGGVGHDEFLGCLNCNSYDRTAICNQYEMGSEYKSNGLFNEFGTFGSEFSSSSPWNEYTSSNSVPVLVDKQGNFYGYFTINSYRYDAFDRASELADLYGKANGDLEVVRNFLCAGK